MLFAKPEPLPDLRTTALDEILAVRVVVGSQVDYLLSPVVVAVLIAISPTVLLDEAIDRRLDLKQPRSCAVLDRQVKEQVGCTTEGRSINLENLAASMRLVAWRAVPVEVPIR
jgi:hypothetical protein